MIIVLIDMSVVFRFGCDPKVYSIHLFIGPHGDRRDVMRRGGEQARKNLSLLFSKPPRARFNPTATASTYTNFIRDLGIES